MAKTSFIKLLGTSALVAAIAAPAVAQQITYGDFSAAYDTYSLDDTSINVFDLDGEIEYSIDQFLLGAGVVSKTFTPDGSDDLTVSNYFASAGYMPMDGILVGAEVTGTSFSSGGDSDSINGYGVFAQYETDQYGFAIRYSMPNSDLDDFSTITYFGQAAVTPDVTVGLIVETAQDVDNSFYMLRADYAAGPIDASAYYASITDADGSLFGADFTYQINNDMRVSADFQNTTDGFFADSSGIAIGGGYQVSDDIWIDATLGQLTTGDQDVTRIGVSVSYEFGAPKRLDRAMFKDAQEDFSNGILGATPLVGIGNTFIIGS